MSVRQFSSRSAAGVKTIRRKALRLAVLVAGGGLAALVAQGGPITTTNLLINSGAELGSLAGWTAGSPTANPGIDTGAADGITPEAGHFDFGGHTAAAGTLSQTVSVLSQGVTTADVNAGTLFADVSFWEQGTSADDAQITLTFLNASGVKISTTSTAIENSHNGTWQTESQDFLIPVMTTSIIYTMDFLGTSGPIDAFIDNNSLLVSTNTVAPPPPPAPDPPPPAPSAPVVTGVPEPSSLGLFGIGALLFGRFLMLRKRQYQS
ncbi:MAG: PEP-CTERM sorting domain-containing protein [Bryobacteraceae bacterium]